MGRPRSIARASRWALLPAFWVVAGCQLAPVKVWNLEQVHAPDGSPSRRGDLKGDMEFMLDELFTFANFGGTNKQDPVAQEKSIDDPFATCLENVVELGNCRRDEKTAGLQAATFAWLAVECTYVLSRERCVLELGELAQAIELADVPAPPAGEPASPEVVKTSFEELVATVKDVLEAPALAGDSLERVVERVRALPLDRAGAVRLLRGTNTLLAKGEKGAVLAPLRALRLDLARRCTALAVRAALEDQHGRVRAAALEASMRAFPDERAAHLRWALVEPMEGIEDRTEVSLRALQLVARYGLPPGGDLPQAEHERGWRELLLQVLRMQVDGPHTTAACTALAKVTGQPATLRPEIWLARWRRSPAAEPESGTGANP